MPPAQNVDSNSHTTRHKFPYTWQIKGGYPAQGIFDHKLKVFSTFACGGGSSMGYKLAGYDVIGCNEIDPEMMKVYRENHHPQLSYLEDIRTFINRSDLPEELYNLDILDGSPPCSVFSIAGQREDAWGKQKKFREGQAAQTLDDLFFEFIKLTKKLQPKCFVAENVRGLIAGNAKGYVVEIIRKFEEAGHNVQLFLLNAATMGVPQSRERVFFIGHRKDLNFPKLKLRFSEAPIVFREIKTDGKGAKSITGKALALWQKRRHGDTALSDACMRIYKKNSFFTHGFIYDNRVVRTIVAGDKNCLFAQPRQLTNREYVLASTFPTDYNFLNLDVPYVVGMSVPPVMMAQVAYQIYQQWFSKGEN
jgi:DNA (cytosine-5)-methyltransferase 1